MDLKEEIEALRRAAGGLRSAIYDLRLDKQQPFIKAVESLVELNRQMTPEREIRLVTQNGFQQEFPETVGVELLRIIQEALTNARRHSSARRVEVRLRINQGEVQAEVADDGQGFEPGVTPGGVGLSVMRERVATLGGSLQIESRPGKGTQIVAKVPAEDGTPDPRHPPDLPG